VIAERQEKYRQGLRERENDAKRQSGQGEDEKVKKERG
jgi:hypothetical protein